MKTFLPVIIAALALASCSTAYKSGQTPDDVYFSPQRSATQRIQDSQDEYVRMDRPQGRKYRYNDEDNYDDYYLRMKVRNRDRWAMLDNELYFNNYYSPYAYRYNPYLTYSPFGYQYFGSPFNNYYNGFGGHFGYGSPAFSYYGGYYNPYRYYNYRPYGHQVIVTNPRGPVYNKPRTSNLNIYNRQQGNNNTYSNPRTRARINNNTYSEPYQSNQNTRPRNSGNELRNVFGNSSSNNTYQSNSESRSYSAPAPSSSSPRSSSGGGGAPTRRF